MQRSSQTLPSNLEFTTGDGSRTEAALQVGAQAVAEGVEADSWQNWPLIMTLAQALAEQRAPDGQLLPPTDAIQLVQQVSVATLARHKSIGYKSDEKGDLFLESLFFTALLLKQHYDQTDDYSSHRRRRVHIFDRRECFSIRPEASLFARVPSIRGLTGTAYCD